jgi:hypothetical protein
VKLVGAVGAAFTTTVPACSVVLVVAAVDWPPLSSPPAKETSTTPAPMTKIARPRRSI